jgi:hypothetical protein
LCCPLTAFSGILHGWHPSQRREGSRRSAGHASRPTGLQGIGLLVAIRLWKSMWQQLRVRLAVRNDSVGACGSCQIEGALGLLSLGARDLALDLAVGTCGPDVINHIPGISNVLADALCRRHSPLNAASWQLPAALVHAKQVACPVRKDTWWRSRAPPGRA